jgi:site-specific DNA-methyltransferase (adenine-specific)
VDSVEIAVTEVAEPFLLIDARELDEVEWLQDNSVALVVTSPPYFAGKEYEAELGKGGVPASYTEYLDLLTDVFRACVKKLEPGGRIAVNVANLGRKPFRNLAADVTEILQDRLRLLLRGEVVWRKAEGASGSCAWGSFRSPGNPVLRDTTERVIIASKQRFDRALSSKKRQAAGLPYESTLTTDEFMEATLDVWSIPPESATRVGHPAPFPVALPERLIGLYTYADDLVLDPFMGAGATLVAAARTGRRAVGCDMEPAYVDLARERVANDPGSPTSDVPRDRKTMDLATAALEKAGFRNVRGGKKVAKLGLGPDLMADDQSGAAWQFDVTGGFVAIPGAGLQRADAVLRALGRAHLLTQGTTPLVLLTSRLPRPGSDADRLLRAGGDPPYVEVVAIASPEGRRVLTKIAAGKAHPGQPKT